MINGLPGFVTIEPGGILQTTRWRSASMGSRRSTSCAIRTSSSICGPIDVNSSPYRGRIVRFRDQDATKRQWRCPHHGFRARTPLIPRRARAPRSRQSRALPQDRAAADADPVLDRRGTGCVRRLGGADADAARLSPEGDGADPLHPCPRRLAGHGRMDRAGGGKPGLSGLAASAGEHRRARDRAGGCGVRRDLPDHRFDLGTPDLGHLVGMGRAADQHAAAVLRLHRLYRAGPRRCRSRRRRPHPGPVRRGGHGAAADHPLFGDLVEHAAPGAEHRPDQLVDRFLDAVAASSSRSGDSRSCSPGWC
jgi:hypothetical protein